MSRKNRNNIYVPEDPAQGPSLFWGIALLFIAPPVGTFIGIYLLLKRGRNEWTRRQLRDFRHYAAIIGDRGSISIRELATRLGKTTEEVVADLQSMINQNMIDPRAYIDRNSLMLYLADDIVETDFAQSSAEPDFVRPVVNFFTNLAGKRSEPKADEPIEAQFVTPQPVPEPVEEEPPRPAPKRERTAPKKSVADSDDFEAKLREIRQLNDDIQNDVVSERIDRIGTLTASIFRVVQEKPERADEVRKFMNYYLPTTLKLLKSYSLMEKQSYQGENIQQSRKKIEDVLETLVHAFEQQQDKLFQSDALDVETDISVLETMMASDGLTEQSRGLHL